MDRDFDAIQEEVVQTKRTSFSHLVAEISIVGEHCKVCRTNLLKVLTTHKNSGCPKDCLDHLPTPQTLVNLEVELSSLAAELNSAVITATLDSFSFYYGRHMLSKTHSKLAKAHNLFDELLTGIKRYSKDPKSCSARKKIFKAFN